MMVTVKSKSVYLDMIQTQQLKLNNQPKLLHHTHIDHLMMNQLSLLKGKQAKNLIDLK